MFYISNSTSSHWVGCAEQEQLLLPSSSSQPCACFHQPWAEDLLTFMFLKPVLVRWACVDMCVFLELPSPQPRPMSATCSMFRDRLKCRHIYAKIPFAPINLQGPQKLTAGQGFASEWDALRLNKEKKKKVLVHTCLTSLFKSIYLGWCHHNIWAKTLLSEFAARLWPVPHLDQRKWNHLCCGLFSRLVTLPQCFTWASKI